MLMPKKRGSRLESSNWLQRILENGSEVFSKIMPVTWHGPVIILTVFVDLNLLRRNGYWVESSRKNKKLFWNLTELSEIGQKNKKCPKSVSCVQHWTAGSRIGHYSRKLDTICLSKYNWTIVSNIEHLCLKSDIGVCNKKLFFKTGY